MRALLIDPEQRIITLVQVILVTAKVRGQSRTSRCSSMQREPWERRETELLRILSGEARSTG